MPRVGRDARRGAGGGLRAAGGVGGALAAPASRCYMEFLAVRLCLCLCLCVCVRVV